MNRRSLRKGEKMSDHKNAYFDSERPNDNFLRSSDDHVDVKMELRKNKLVDKVARRLSKLKLAEGDTKENRGLIHPTAAINMDAPQKEITHHYYLKKMSPITRSSKKTNDRASKSPAEELKAKVSKPSVRKVRAKPLKIEEVVVEIVEHLRDMKQTANKQVEIAERQAEAINEQTKAIIETAAAIQLYLKFLRDPIEGSVNPAKISENPQGSSNDAGGTTDGLNQGGATDDDAFQIQILELPSSVVSLSKEDDPLFKTPLP